MSLELDPDEESALAAELRRLIADDRYPLSRRIDPHPAGHRRQARSAASP
jgi:hypothetical protein